MKALRARTAFVTGAGSGIGRALAHELSLAGANLALTDIDEVGLRQTVDTLPARVRVSAHLCDASNRGQMERARDEALAHHGAMHLVINNAGITIYSRFDEYSDQDIERLIGINLMGVIYGCRMWLPTLKAQEEAHIVNISSMASFAGLPYQSLYSATKAAVRMLSESMSVELANTGVGVTAVFPGTVRTNVLASAASKDAAVTDTLSNLMKRFGLPSEVAAQRIVRAILDNEPELRMCAESWLLEYAKRFRPHGTRSFMARVVRLVEHYRPPGSGDPK